jgi:uncharacterized membrane-anchored protein YhcB (DUF1043 family)
MSTEKIVGFITGVIVGVLILVLALNGRRWYNQLFNKNKKS